MESGDRIFEKFKCTVARFSMISPGDRVLAALSGGSDSVAMLLLLKKMESEVPFSLRAFHYHHMIRGAEADRDLEFCEKLCEKWEIPFFSERGDVPAFAEQEGLSLEEAARKLRYGALFRCADAWDQEDDGEFGGDSSENKAKIAVAHNYGDRAETVFFHIVRGTSLEGLRGIRRINGRIIRPLSDLTKEETYRVCEAFGTDYVTDTTNLERTAVRNRIRLEVFPFIDRTLDCDIEKKLTELSEIAEEDGDFLRKEAEKAFSRVAVSEDGAVRLNGESFRELHPAIRKRVLRKALSLTENDGEFPFRDGVSVTGSMLSRGVAYVLANRGGGYLEMGKGILLKKRGDDFLLLGASRLNGIFENAAENGTTDIFENIPENPPKGSLALPASAEPCVLTLPAADGTFLSGNQLFTVIRTAEKTELDAYLKLAKKNRNAAVFDGPELERRAEKAGNLSLRHPETGDRFSPFGGTGGKPLRRFFTDEKIPPESRKSVWVLAAGSEVLHVFGVRRSKFAAIQDPSEFGIIIIRA